MPVLQFKGKTAVENYHHTVPHHRLEFEAKLSLLPKGEKPSLDGNLIIEGDNLLALKALLPTHAGRVKCIYIDPPYNTGNEGWVYNDNLTQPQFKEWIGRTVGKEGEDACRHDKWCCMMYPRLTLLRELLREDGSIWISIDDNEVQNLRSLMDEVFGNDNFVATVIWEKVYSPKSSAKYLSENHDYIVVYAKKKPLWKRRLLPRTDEGEALRMIVDTTSGDRESKPREIRVRPEFAQMYRQFDGKIYLPHFCVRTGKTYERLDYFEHLLTHIDVDAFEYGEISSEKWHLAKAAAEARDRYYRWTLGQSELERQYESDVDQWETDSQVLSWLSASLPFEYISFKKLRHIVRHVYDRLRAAELPHMVEGRLALIKTVVRDKIAEFVQEQMDKQTEAAFRRLFDDGRLVFYLECAECRFPIPDSVTINATRRLVHNDGDQVQRSLFDYVEDEAHNEYERAVALALDRDENVLWWYRNLIGDDQFSIQGYRRHRIRPDFVVQDKAERKPRHRVIVLESKGQHLESNPDTNYKRRIAEIFEQVGHEVTWQQLGEDFKDHIFRFQILDEAGAAGTDWRDTLIELMLAAN
jgi:hypothetical protein